MTTNPQEPTAQEELVKYLLKNYSLSAGEANHLAMYITQKQLEATKQGWADGWYARHQAEDYSALIGKLKALKPQNGAFFLLGEIERAGAELKKGLQI